MSDHDFVKVELRSDGYVETPWAEPLGGNEYRLENSPFFAYGLSYNDVIVAENCDGCNFPVFRRVVRKGGHRTIRVVLDPPADQAPESQQVLDGVVELGCTYEGANPGYLAVDIPPSIPLETVRTYLIESGMEWEHADPRYEDLFPV